ncbi:PREDICTED: zinc finger protein 236 [Rhagoletis zephyria]|uniref:zinc finger protein 236 n=1 Tax=Rhagoletis zephyria TaxID=28612 RepID=UPI0008118498|nr:PREDICTED: zinc finger protein 236 [Rhagoletis zephyria]
MKVVHYTPAKEELLPTRKIMCTYPNCDSTFTNVGNLDMHLKRHHGKQPTKSLDLSEKECLFHCPQLECTYHEAHTSKMHFKTLKYLRQHYQKVHVAKTNICNQCGKAFISSSQLKVHMERMCGVKYTCRECGWVYSSMEALQTHGKRKEHKVRDDRVIEKKAPSTRKRHAAEVRNENNDQETQTDVPPAAKCVGETNIQAGTSKTCTKSTHDKNVSTDTQPLNDIAEPRNIETQTENQMIRSLRQTTFNTSTPTMHSSLATSQLLPPSTHTYTQTYDDLFADSLLGLTDIQTQTNWSSFTDAAATAEEFSSHAYNTSSAGTCTRCAYDELLVSTETQTSFTQCLLESRTTTGDSEDGTFSNLYQTQQTQTCDMLLGALFGAQESDLLSGYHSTYTQT